MTLQQQIAEALGVKAEIDPEAEVERRVSFLADYLRTTGAKGFVLGISGGQDSTLAGRLAQLAVERVRAEGGEASPSRDGETALRVHFHSRADDGAESRCDQ